MNKYLIIAIIVLLIFVAVRYKKKQQEVAAAAAAAQPVSSNLGTATNPTGTYTVGTVHTASTGVILVNQPPVIQRTIAPTPAINNYSING